VGQQANFKNPANY